MPYRFISVHAIQAVQGVAVVVFNLCSVLMQKSRRCHGEVCLLAVPVSRAAFLTTASVGCQAVLPHPVF